MELEQLRIFVAVAEHGSFTKGAKHLYISHSTTSRAVAALEEELGVRLLRRDNRVLGLTEEGELLLCGARELLAQSQALAETVQGKRERADKNGGAGIQTL